MFILETEQTRMYSYTLLYKGNIKGSVSEKIVHQIPGFPSAYTLCNQQMDKGIKNQPITN